MKGKSVNVRNQSMAVTPNRSAPNSASRSAHKSPAPPSASQVHFIPTPPRGVTIADLTEEEKQKVAKLAARVIDLQQQIVQMQQASEDEQRRHKDEVQGIHSMIEGQISIIEDRIKLKDETISKLITKEQMLTSMLALYQAKLKNMADISRLATDNEGYNKKRLGQLQGEVEHLQTQLQQQKLQQGSIDKTTEVFEERIKAIEARHAKRVKLLEDTVSEETDKRLRTEKVNLEFSSENLLLKSQVQQLQFQLQQKQMQLSASFADSEFLRKEASTSQATGLSNDAATGAAVEPPPAESVQSKSQTGPYDDYSLMFNTSRPDLGEDPPVMDTSFLSQPSLATSTPPRSAISTRVPFQGGEQDASAVSSVASSLQMSAGRGKLVDYSPPRNDHHHNRSNNVASTSQPPLDPFPTSIPERVSASASASASAVPVSVSVSRSQSLLPPPVASSTPPRAPSSNNNHNHKHTTGAGSVKPPLPPPPAPTASTSSRTDASTASSAAHEYSLLHHLSAEQRKKARSSLEHLSHVSQQPSMSVASSADLMSASFDHSSAYSQQSHHSYSHMQNQHSMNSGDSFFEHADSSVARSTHAPAATATASASGVHERDAYLGIAGITTKKKQKLPVSDSPRIEVLKKKKKKLSSSTPQHLPMSHSKTIMTSAAVRSELVKSHTKPRTWKKLRAPGVAGVLSSLMDLSHDDVLHSVVEGSEDVVTHAKAQNHTRAVSAPSSSSRVKKDSHNVSANRLRPRDDMSYDTMLFELMDELEDPSPPAVQHTSSRRSTGKQPEHDASAHDDEDPDISGAVDASELEAQTSSPAAAEKTKPRRRKTRRTT